MSREMNEIYAIRETIGYEYTVNSVDYPHVSVRALIEFLT